MALISDDSLGFLESINGYKQSDFKANKYEYTIGKVILFEN